MSEPDELVRFETDGLDEQFSMLLKNIKKIVEYNGKKYLLEDYSVVIDPATFEQAPKITLLPLDYVDVIGEDINNIKPIASYKDFNVDDEIIFSKDGVELNGYVGAVFRDAVVILVKDKDENGNEVTRKLPQEYLKYVRKK